MKRVTIKDIARVSGYSANCVSRALMNADDISEATKEKIRELANEMGYIPNAGAASLRSGNKQTVGIIIDNLSNPFYTIMMEYMRWVFAEEKYIFITFYAASTYCTEAEIKQAVSANVGGLITFLSPDDAAERLVSKLNLPLVVLGRRSTEHDCFIINDYLGGFRATEYLIFRGVRRIYYLSDSPDTSCSEDRAKGYRAAMEKYGLDCKEFYPQFGESPTELIKRVVASGDIPDGVFCFSDCLAYLLIDELKRKEICGVETIGFDHLRHEMHYFSKIPSVGYDKARLGTEAANRLLARIRGSTDECTVYIEDVYLEVEC